MKIRFGDHEITMAKETVENLISEIAEAMKSGIEAVIDEKEESIILTLNTNEGNEIVAMTSTDLIEVISIPLKDLVEERICRFEDSHTRVKDLNLLALELKELADKVEQAVRRTKIY